MAAGGGVRAVAKAYVVLGLAAACFALFALSLDPATYGQLQLQMIKESDLQQQQLEQGVTAAEVMEMSAAAVVLLLFAVGQAVAGTGRCLGSSTYRQVISVCLLQHHHVLRSPLGLRAASSSSSAARSSTACGPMK